MCRRLFSFPSTYLSVLKHHSMPVVYPRQSGAASFGDSYGPGKIAGIVIIVAIILFVAGLYIYRRKQWKRNEKARSLRARKFLRVTFPRPAPDPELPPYEGPRQPEAIYQQGYGQTHALADGSRTPPRSPPPGRASTPPYEGHAADRQAGPLSDAPPAYQEHDQQRWGRSGCSR